MGRLTPFTGGRTEFTFAFLLPARGKVFSNSLDDLDSASSGISPLNQPWRLTQNVRAQNWRSNGMLINRLISKENN